MHASTFRLLALQGLLLPCGSAPVKRCVEDFSALLQQQSQSGQAEDLQANARDVIMSKFALSDFTAEPSLQGEWPGTDKSRDEAKDGTKVVDEVKDGPNDDKEKGPDANKIWDEAKDGTKVVDEVKDGAKGIPGEAVKLKRREKKKKNMDEVRRRVQNAANEASEKMTTALNHALDVMKEEADKLLTETATEKTELHNSLKDELANVPSGATILERFEEIANKVITSTWGRWQALRAVVDHTAKSIEAGLEAAGQGPLAQQLSNGMGTAGASLEEFSKKLQDCDGALKGISKMGRKEAEGVFHRVNQSLHEALLHAGAFVAEFEQSFQDITERVSDRLVLASEVAAMAVGSNGTEDAELAFASVMQHVTSVAWRVRMSARDLVEGLHRNMATVMEASNITTPEGSNTTDSEFPVERGSAIGLRLPLTAVLAVVLGAVIAAEGH